MTTYYIRQDGTAANKAAATDPTSASTSMSVATHNDTGDSFSPGDRIRASSRGGDITSQLIPPDSGTVGSRITYENEEGYVPNLLGGLNVNGVDYLDLIGLESDAAITSNFLFQGTATGIRTYDLIALNSANQCLQHLNTCSVTHYRLTAKYGTDECLSCHDSPTVKVYGGLFDGNGGSGSSACINWIDDAVIELWDMELLASSGATDRTIQASPGVTGGSFKAYRCRIVENSWNSAAYPIDHVNGDVEYHHCIFDLSGGVTGCTYYLLGRSSLDSFYLYNCLFYGGSVSSGVVFNQQQDAITNCGFCNTNNVSLYSANGVSYCGFYNAGAGKGSPNQTGDPLLDTDTENVDLSGEYGGTWNKTAQYRPGAGSAWLANGTDLSGSMSDARAYDLAAHPASWAIGPLEEAVGNSYTEDLRATATGNCRVSESVLSAERIRATATAECRLPNTIEATESTRCNAGGLARLVDQAVAVESFRAHGTGACRMVDVFATASSAVGGPYRVVTASLFVPGVRKAGLWAPGAMAQTIHAPGAMKSACLA